MAKFVANCWILIVHETSIIHSTGHIMMKDSNFSSLMTSSLSPKALGARQRMTLQVGPLVIDAMALPSYAES